jgi:hypothetical protein
MITENVIGTQIVATNVNVSPNKYAVSSFDMKVAGYSSYRKPSRQFRLNSEVTYVFYQCMESAVLTTSCPPDT